MYTTKQAAQYLCVSTARIRQLIGEGRLEAQSNGKSWFIAENSLDEYREQATLGRPSTKQAKWKKKFTPKKYTLMSGKHEVAHITYDPYELRFTQIHVLDWQRVPLAIRSYRVQDAYVKAFNEWWQARGIPGSRENLSKRLHELELSSAAQLPLRSYGLSLSDQYWLLPDDSNIQWEEVNFFKNSYDMGFDEEDKKFYSAAGSWMNAVGLSSPDNTTDGMLNKRWLMDEEGNRVLIKGNGTSGREVYNEVIATMLYRRLLSADRYVEYKLCDWRGNDVSVCKTFLRENEEFIPARYVFHLKKKPNNHSEFRHYCEICEDLGISYIENQLTRMLVCDTILANTDRHWGNFGVIRNIDTLEYRWAPIFDTGTSLWVHARPKEIISGNYYYQSKPFYKDPNRQLDLLIDASWYNPLALDGFAHDVKSYLVKALVNEELAAAISKGINHQIETVNAWARKAPSNSLPKSWLENPEKLTTLWL